MTLDHRIRELIAVGTTIGANCHACLQHHAAKARAMGIPDDDVAEAIAVGRAVRRGAQGSIDKLADALLSDKRSTPPLPTADCGCGGKGAEPPTS